MLGFYAMISHLEEQPELDLFSFRCRDHRTLVRTVQDIGIWPGTQQGALIQHRPVQDINATSVTCNPPRDLNSGHGGLRGVANMEVEEVKRQVASVAENGGRLESEDGGPLARRQDTAIEQAI